MLRSYVKDDSKNDAIAFMSSVWHSQEQWTSQPEKVGHEPEPPNPDRITQEPANM